MKIQLINDRGGIVDLNGKVEFCADCRDTVFGNIVAAWDVGRIAGTNYYIIILLQLI
jgi:hypothetical protein